MWKTFVSGHMVYKHCCDFGLCSRQPLRSQQRRRNDRDAVFSAIGVCAGRDDDGVEEVGSYLFPQPEEVANVLVLHSSAQFDLHSHNSLICPLNDQIHFTCAAVLAQVPHTCLRGLRVDADAQGNERFEQLAE